MALKLLYITNNPEIAKIAEAYSVDRIWIDLEKNGKNIRQANMNTVKSDHVITDVSVIRSCIKKAELLVRVNPIFEGSKEEIDEVIERGADVIMLPMFRTKEEVAKFVEYVGNRARTLLLLETIQGEHNIEDILSEFHVDEVHIGLNDLHLEYGSKFMFELLANGKVEEICNKIKKFNIPYGFGGIAKLDEGLLPARHIIAEHYRLGSSMAILSRSFYDTWIENDLREIERTFRFGIAEIRDYEMRLMNEDSSYFNKNKLMVQQEIETILKKIDK